MARAYQHRLWPQPNAVFAAEGARGLLRGSRGRASTAKRQLLAQGQAGNSSMISRMFDVDGDGGFSAADYVALLRLGLAWSNAYAEDAAPWLRAFRRITGVDKVSAVQLQSTDPAFLCGRCSLNGPLPLQLLRASCGMRPCMLIDFSGESVKKCCSAMEAMACRLSIVWALAVQQ